MRTLRVFLAVVAITWGLILLIGMWGSDAFGSDQSLVEGIPGILLFAGGLTYIWKLTGFSGLKKTPTKPSDSQTSKDQQ